MRRSRNSRPRLFNGDLISKLSQQELFLKLIHPGISLYEHLKFN